MDERSPSAWGRRAPEPWERGSFELARDFQGSILALIDRASGQVVERYRYTPFGEVTIEDDQGNALSESAFGNDRFFLGRPFDALTGQCDLRARWYDPTTGSFLAPDPLGPVDSWNLYQYGFGTPATWMDPWGLQASEAAGGGGMLWWIGRGLRVAGWMIAAVEPTPIGECLMVAATAVTVAALYQDAQEGQRGESATPDDEGGGTTGNGPEDPEDGRFRRALERLRNKAKSRNDINKGENLEIEGGVEDANRDFASLNPKNPRKGPEGQTIGDLPGGNTAIISNSKKGKLTMEVQIKDSVGRVVRRYKFRYTRSPGAAQSGGQ